MFIIFKLLCKVGMVFVYYDNVMYIVYIINFFYIIFK